MLRTYNQYIKKTTFIWILHSIGIIKVARAYIGNCEINIKKDIKKCNAYSSGNNKCASHER